MSRKLEGEATSKPEETEKVKKIDELKSALIEQAEGARADENDQNIRNKPYSNIPEVDQILNEIKSQSKIGPLDDIKPSQSFKRDLMQRPGPKVPHEHLGKPPSLHQRKIMAKTDAHEFKYSLKSQQQRKGSQRGQMEGDPSQYSVNLNSLSTIKEITKAHGMPGSASTMGSKKYFSKDKRSGDNSDSQSLTPIDHQEALKKLIRSLPSFKNREQNAQSSQSESSFTKPKSKVLHLDHLKNVKSRVGSKMDTSAIDALPDSSPHKPKGKAMRNNLMDDKRA